MKTEVVTPKAYADEAIRLSKEVQAVNDVRPVNFMKMMKQNRGTINMYSPFGPSGDGLERKNPVIVALGDSVTAGHFEFAGKVPDIFELVDAGLLGEDGAVEITDVRQSYVEQFRGMLIDKYEQTSVSIINCGIAGDTIIGMQKRLYRDVVRYQPDLVLINGTLNWSDMEGSTADFEKVLAEIIQTIKTETHAEIILLTPNMEIRMPYLPAPTKSTLIERVEVVRKLAKETGVCLADAYKVWEAYEATGNPVVELLANRSNHPTVTGHTIYANVLMQLFIKSWR